MLRLFQTTTTVADRIDEYVEQGKEIIEAAKTDPAVLGVLIGVGVLTAGVFLWGLTKQVFKAALVAGVLSVGVWIWYFNIR